MALLLSSLVLMAFGVFQAKGSVGKCCDQGFTVGRQVVEYNVACTKEYLDTSSVEGVDTRICTSVFTSCCRNGAMRGFCTEGVKHAMAGLECRANSRIGGDQQRTCCQCCKGGVKVGVAGGDCSARKGSPLCSEAFQSCCKAQLTAATTQTALTTAVPVTAVAVTVALPITKNASKEVTCADLKCSHACTATSNGSQCACREGYQLDSDDVTCTDVDECVVESACRSTQLCLNIKGGHICLQRCPYGYQIVGRRCEDVDECQSGQSRCSSQFKCENTVGSYRCRRQSCQPGFRVSREQCVDIDECSENKRMCGEGGVCYNQYGSYYCLCRLGYKKDETTGQCVDRDECTEKTRACDYKCINKPGSFECRCPLGYKTLRTKCIDENECLNGKSKCPEGYSCFNNFGSYSCIKNTCPNKHYVQKTQQECKLFCMVRGQCKYHLEQSIKWQAFRYRKIVKADEFQFTYIVRVKAYFIRPTITFYLHSGNDDKEFFVESIDEETAKVVNIKDLTGPKTYQLRLHADISYNGRITTRFVYFFYIYVSTYDF